MVRNRIVLLSLIIGILGAAFVAIFRDRDGSQDVGAAERQQAVSSEGTDAGFTLLHKGGERKLQSPLAQISSALGAFGPAAACATGLINLCTTSQHQGTSPCSVR